MPFKFDTQWQLFRRLSLASRLAWTVLVLGLAGAAVTVVAAVFLFAYMAQQEVEARWRSDTEDFAAIIASPLESYSFSGVSDLARVFTRENELTQDLEVWHLDGVKVVTIGEAMPSPGIETEGIVDFPVYALDGVEQIGLVRIRKSASNQIKSLGRYLPAAVLLIFCSTVITSLLLQRRLTRYLANPISQLAERMRSFDLRQTTQLPLQEGSASELVQLSDHFRSMASRIREQATTDPVTQLRNRFYFEGYLLKASQQLAKSCAVLLLDLDHFKSVNDNFGHPMGDALLRMVAERLSVLMFDGASIARMGGDEFAVWFDHRCSYQEVQKVAKRISDALVEPFYLSTGTVLYIKASGGLASYPHDVAHPDELLRAADLALYQAKEQRNGEVSNYTPELASSAQEWMEISSHLRERIEGESLTFYVQPIVDPYSGQLWGHEVLLRLFRPSGQAFNTETVLRVAKQIDVMPAITKQTFHFALRLLSDNLLDGKLNINLSPEQVVSLSSKQIEHYLLTTPLEVRQRLVIELTEQSLLDRADVLGPISRIHRLGFPIALDDFGSGYSSMSCLGSFPLSYVKLDKSLTKRILDVERDRLLLASMVQMCHALGFKLIAEGIENQEQYDLLRELGCDLVQGYFLGKPQRMLKSVKAIQLA